METLAEVGDTLKATLASGQNATVEPMLTLLTFNVLFPIYLQPFGFITDYNTRYQYQLEELFPSMNADIICLQEITEEYIPELERSELIKQGYKFTPPMPPTYSSHYPMILSRLPFELLYNKERFCICLFTKDDVDFIVIATHLYYTEIDREIRQQQMRDLDQVLKTLTDR